MVIEALKKINSLKFEKSSKFWFEKVKKMLVQLVLPIFFTIVINPLNLIFNQFHEKFQRFNFTNFFLMNFQLHEKNSMHKISIPDLAVEGRVRVVLVLSPKEELFTLLRSELEMGFSLLSTALLAFSCCPAA